MVSYYLNYLQQFVFCFLRNWVELRTFIKGEKKCALDSDIIAPRSRELTNCVTKGLNKKSYSIKVNNSVCFSIISTSTIIALEWTTVWWEPVEGWTTHRSHIRAVPVPSTYPDLAYEVGLWVMRCAAPRHK